MYTVRGRTVAAGATADLAIAQLWNPHASQIIRVLFVAFSVAAAPANVQSLRVQRTSARGTPGSSVTPGREADSNYGGAPPSGAILDLAAFTVQPTYVGTSIGLLGYSGVPVAGLYVDIDFGSGIDIPAGMGLAIATCEDASNWQKSEVTFAWKEDMV